MSRSVLAFPRKPARADREAHRGESAALAAVCFILMALIACLAWLAQGAGR